MSKVALITGASSGFGYEFVKLFANDRFDLILVARSIDKLKQIKEEFPQTNITVIQKDLTKPNAVKELYQEVQEKNLRVDVLVNNAGFGSQGQFDLLSAKEQLNMIQLNVNALTELTHYFVQGMKQRKVGKILNVASMAAFQPGPYMAVYFATKAYVLSLSEALVEELKGFGITVTTLCPGAAKTNFAKVAHVEDKKMFKSAMDASKVCRIGYQGMMKGKRVVIPGGVNKISAYTSKFLPRSLVTKVIKKITR